MTDGSGVGGPVIGPAGEGWGCDFLRRVAEAAVQLSMETDVEG